MNTESSANGKENTWNILYRGLLSSCNYGCHYCPFAKRANTVSELHQDEVELARFVDWIGVQQNRLGVLFTPWGEALIHGYYRRALERISWMPHVYRVAIQTNLSAPLEELGGANQRTLALWATFHPSEISLEGFLTQCRVLDRMGIRYSVGVVGVREEFEVIEELRRSLRPEIYLWINALNQDAAYYQLDEVARFQVIDPYFHWNLRNQASRGKPCGAGETSFTVDGQGVARRCHFIPEVIGNIYEPGFPRTLQRRLCPQETCSCHIGYVHIPELELGKLYGEGILERIPTHWPEIAVAYLPSRNSSGVNHSAINRAGEPTGFG